MCGILGVQGNFQQLAIQAALSKISHRGPDAQGLFSSQDGRTSLGHTRLSIIDLSATGSQPMLSQDGKVVLVFNGEIYNFPEIRIDLENKGYNFRGSSDTEVILNAYLHYGRAMLPMLNGIFALAIYDSRDNSVLLARDPMGVKPVYYSVCESGFAFSSEVKALKELVSLGTEINLHAVSSYLSYLWCPGEDTLIQSVKKLLPGELVFVKQGKIQEKTLWHQPIAWRSPLPPIGSLAEAIAGVESHLMNAVKRQMVADVPVGAFLSGGLDSTSIVAFAKKIKPDIECFTIKSTVQDPGVTDDFPYALRAAKILGVKLHMVEISPEMMLDGIKNLVYQLDEPLADPAPLNVLFISQLARQSGLKVLLSGAAGDDLFTGYRRHLLGAWQKYLDMLPLWLRQFLVGQGNRLDKSSAIGRQLAKALRSIQYTGDAAIENSFRWIDREVLLSLFSTEAKLKLNRVDSNPMRDFLQKCHGSNSSLQKMLALEQRFFLADHNLLYTDKMSMATGVEVRVPFLDLDLVDYAARIPDGWKQKGSEGKWVLKKAMEPHLPRSLIYRKKTGFGAPLRQWIRNELAEAVHDLLSERSLERRNIWDYKSVSHLIESNQSGRIDASYTIFSMMCIELWFRHFMDNR